MAWNRDAPAAAVYRTRAHKQARAAFIAQHRPGDPCCLCGHPMWSHPSKLHADHDPTDPNRYRGLAHGTEPCQDCGQRCNVVDGARRGRQRQTRPTRWTL